MSGVAAALAVFRKEWVDALRDRRTLVVVLLSSVLMGPLVLVALSSLVAALETRAEQRELLVDGIEAAPTLVNFVQRQTWTVRAAPPDHEARLRDGSLDQPVLRLPADFEDALRRGDLPRIELVSDSANRRAQAAMGRIERLLSGFNQERAALALALRGVAPDPLTVFQVDTRDLASAQTRAVQITGLLPFFVLMAVLYGALNGALDSTAGERERGSLEPLLMNPAPPAALVVGKWLAVSAVAYLIAVLSCVSFVPAQWLLRSDALQALFQFGWREVGWFLWLMLPFVSCVSALLMAVAIRCRSIKEAQANATVVVLAVSLLPLYTVFSEGGAAAWEAWVPALAQHALMTRVLKGEDPAAAQWLLPLGVAALLTTVSLAWVARRLRAAAVK